MKHRAGSAAEFPAQSCTVREIAGRRIAIWHHEGTFYATRDSCPHMGAPLSSGSISGTMLPSPAKEYSYGMEGHVLRCPWHGYEFCLDTGEPLFGTSALRVVTYPVSIEGGDVYVDLKSLPSAKKGS